MKEKMGNFWKSSMSSFFGLVMLTHGILSASTVSPEQAEMEDRVENLEDQLENVRISGILKDPVAKLFREDFYLGKSESYDFHTSYYGGGCQYLGTNRGEVKSVQTFGKCVRLFVNSICSGWSFAVYPGSPKSDQVLSRLTKVESVGPCMSDEFVNADFTDATNGLTVRKNSRNVTRLVPDLLYFAEDGKGGRAKATNSQFSLSRYTLGHKDRLEFVHALIYRTHLSIHDGDSHGQLTTAFRSLQPLEGDVAGFAIFPSIGGPSNDRTNMFPQSESANRVLQEVTKKIRRFLLHTNGWVYLDLTLLYENGMKTRPYAFYYRVNYYDTTIEYDHVFN